MSTLQSKDGVRFIVVVTATSEVPAERAYPVTFAVAGALRLQRNVILSEAAVKMITIRKCLCSTADAKDLSDGRLITQRWERFFAAVTAKSKSAVT